MPEIRVPCAGGRLPQYQSSECAGADLRAELSAELTLEPGERAAVPTGLRLAIPPRLCFAIGGLAFLFPATIWIDLAGAMAIAAGIALSGSRLASEDKPSISKE